VRHHVWSLMLGCIFVLSGCGTPPQPTTPAVAPATSAEPTARLQQFGPFFDSSTPPDETCTRQTASWGNETGKWVTGPRYCSYWPSDESEREGFSLCVGAWQDVVVEASLRYYTLPSRVGIVVRALNPNDAIVFVISQAGGESGFWQIRSGSGDSSTQAEERWSEPIDPHPLVLPRGGGTEAVVARVRVEAVGNRLVAYVNSLETSVLENAPIRQGRVGLYMNNDGTEQSWADVIIRAP
jgi:hypothetical protein